MKDALNFELDQSQLHPSFKKLNHELEANARKADQKLNIANGLCLTGGDVGKEFKALLKDCYDAELFTGGLDKINAWVRKKTEGKIEKILEKLTSNSACVLLNAVYFKGNWASQFKKERTRDAFFKVSYEKKVQVPFMYQKNDFKLLEKFNFNAASIPYQGGNMSMVILLPHEVDGLIKLERLLTPERLNEWLSDLDKQSVRKMVLQIPKYKLETKYDLIPSFKNLGMNDAFEGGVADFRGMGWPKGDLWIAQIKHKAFVEVNEEGTEAAAATAVEMVTKSASRDPRFCADHPFIFIIRDNQTGSILFMGRMIDPSNIDE